MLLVLAAALVVATPLLAALRLALAAIVIGVGCGWRRRGFVDHLRDWGRPRGRNLALGDVGGADGLHPLGRAVKPGTGARTALGFGRLAAGGVRACGFFGGFVGGFHVCGL